MDVLTCQKMSKKLIIGEELTCKKLETQKRASKCRVCNRLCFYSYYGVLSCEGGINNKRFKFFYCLFQKDANNFFGDLSRSILFINVGKKRKIVISLKKVSLKYLKKEKGFFLPRDLGSFAERSFFFITFFLYLNLDHQTSYPFYRVLRDVSKDI
jgi:hypothetical protein